MLKKLCKSKGNSEKLKLSQVKTLCGVYCYKQPIAHNPVTFCLFLPIYTELNPWKKLQCVYVCNKTYTQTTHSNKIWTQSHSSRVMKGKWTVLFEMLQACLCRSTSHCVFVALRWGTARWTVCLVLLNPPPPQPHPHHRGPGATLGPIKLPRAHSWWSSFTSWHIWDPSIIHAPGRWSIGVLHHGATVGGGRRGCCFRVSASWQSENLCVSAHYFWMIGGV